MSLISISMILLFICSTFFIFFCLILSLALLLLSPSEFLGELHPSFFIFVISILYLQLFYSRISSFPFLFQTFKVPVVIVSCLCLMKLCVFLFVFFPRLTFNPFVCFVYFLRPCSSFSFFTISFCNFFFIIF